MKIEKRVGPFAAFTLFEWVLVGGLVAALAIVTLHATGVIQAYEHGIQIGYVFVDWHYLVNADARTEISEV